MSLTGKTRYRVKKTFMGYCLVLQVEEKDYIHDSSGGGHDCAFWRDAKAEDLAALKEDGAK